MSVITINTADAKEQFNDLINHVAHDKERIILTRRGKEIAAIIPFEDLQLILGSQDKQDLHDAIDCRQACKALHRPVKPERTDPALK